MSDEKLQTEKYIQETPEDSEYLRRANREKWTPLRIRRAIRNMILASVAVLIVSGCVLHFSGNTHYKSDGIRLGRIFKAMIAELDQQSKIWDIIGL